MDETKAPRGNRSRATPFAASSRHRVDIDRIEADLLGTRPGKIDPDSDRSRVHHRVPTFPHRTFPQSGAAGRDKIPGTKARNVSKLFIQQRHGDSRELPQSTDI